MANKRMKSAGFMKGLFGIEKNALPGGENEVKKVLTATLFHSVSSVWVNY